jgi:hypothetical protein
MLLLFLMMMMMMMMMLLLLMMMMMMMRRRRSVCLDSGGFVLSGGGQSRGEVNGDRCIPPASFAIRGGLEPWYPSSEISLDCLLPHKDRARRLQQTPVVPPRLLPSPCAVQEMSPPHPPHPLKSNAPPRSPSSLQAMQHPNNNTTFPSFIPSLFHKRPYCCRPCPLLTRSSSPFEASPCRQWSRAESQLCSSGGSQALRAADGPFGD